MDAVPMVKEKYRKKFAEATAVAFRTVYAEIFEEIGEKEVFSADVICDSLQAPKDRSMGWFALPVFRYAKLLKGKPPEIAVKVATLIKWEFGPATQAASGFINCSVDPERLSKETLNQILAEQAEYGSNDLGNDKTYLVEYSSPNIAKPFGIMHLRSTVLGNSLRRIYKKLGYDVVGINYPGDWGTQFGKMIIAYEKWSDEKTLTGNVVKNLLAIYVRFHEEAKENPELEDQARDAFKRLETGDPETVKLWETFKTISHAEFERVYGLLGVEFDWVYGEAELNDRMGPLIERLESAGLTSISQGALVVQLKDEQLPPLLLRKRDGATLYATRDLAGMVYRWEKYPSFHESLYVVNIAQSDHFKQCFQVMEMLEDAEKLPVDNRMSGRLKHIDFGWLRFGGKSMSTREGNIVLLEDVIGEAKTLVREKINEKNPDLSNIDETAHMIGTGAVIFSQLSLRRNRDVDFRWEEVLGFEGETGPYLQYTHARLCSLLRKYGSEVTSEIDYGLLTGEEEQAVVEALADFPEVVVDAGSQYEPCFIAAYLLKLAAAFNKVYQRKDDQGNIERIISDDNTLTAARIALVKAVQVVIREGLYLLGLEAPDEM